MTSLVKTKTSKAVTPDHVPVLLAEMLTALAVRPGGDYLDATFGAGGHSGAILAAGAGRVFGLDRDPAAVARGRQLTAEQPSFTMLEGCFGDMAGLLADARVDRLDGIVLDLGLSTLQLADPARGFSFALDGPLDMRMSARGPSAAELINHADEAELAAILHRYGEERAARRIARAIVERRRRGAIATTHELAELVASVIGRAGGRIDPATRTFQALRIHLNDELGELERALAAAEELARTRRSSGRGRLSLARRPHGQAVPRGAERPGPAALTSSARAAGHSVGGALSIALPASDQARPGRARRQSAGPIGASARRRAIG